MKIKGINHVDKFYENERAFWLDLEEIPEELIEQAKKIDGDNFSESRFGMLVVQTGYNWFVCMDAPSKDVYYIDNNGNRHWMKYVMSEEEEQHAIDYCVNS